MEILHNHIGFRPKSSKIMIVQTGDTPNKDSSLYAELFGIGIEKPLMKLFPVSSGSVPGWSNRYFYRFDFSMFDEPGSYRFCVHGENKNEYGQPFYISEDIADSDMMSDILFYLKGQRSSGRWDEADRSVPFYGGRQGTVDVHGGWFDASGDYSKYLSHLSYANYLNPQQIPLTVWVLTQLGEMFARHDVHKGSLLEERAFEEAWWGADFLMRMQDPEGYFYTTVFDVWNKKSEDRMICAFKTQKGYRLDSYQAAFRQGGGMAIAALARIARISRNDIPSDGFTPSECLVAAIKGYRHLLEHNQEYLDNGKENIIDCYCACIAALELLESTNEEFYIKESRSWIEKLAQYYDDRLKGWKVEIGLDRPFYHASDSGLIIVALLRYLSIESDKKRKQPVARIVITSIENELERVDSVYNPFGLSRQLVQAVGDKRIRESFFVPHDNESGYWWQGENARLASMVCAAHMVGESSLTLMLDAGYDQDAPQRATQLSKRLSQFADAHFDWILGCNPFDMCMLQGYGRNNPRYELHKPNAPGGICNGITAGFRDENDIDFLPSELKGRGDHIWRWGEQWIVHATWFAMALAMRMK
ncbi:MAG: glycoside hydrolase [Spirochaetales bacterium]|nr:glycoside hydrolase [Spirochaetales bacterium]